MALARNPLRYESLFKSMSLDSDIRLFIRHLGFWSARRSKACGKYDGAGVSSIWSASNGRNIGEENFVEADFILDVCRIHIFFLRPFVAETDDVFWIGFFRNHLLWDEFAGVSPCFKHSLSHSVFKFSL